MSKNIEIKKGIVAEIKEKFEKAQTAVLVDYRGLNVAEVTELRNQLRKAGVEYAVLKNTMINLATKDMGFDGIEKHLEGPTARTSTRRASPLWPQRPAGRSSSRGSWAA